MDRIIKIEKGDPTTCVLTLSDNGTTNANPGDQVTWEIVAGSGVAAITEIIVDQGSTNVFIKKPEQLPGGSTSWEGTINPDLPPDTVESYTIKWTTAGSGWLNQGGGKACSYDPQIIVNPK